MKNFSFKRLTAWLLVFMTVLSVLPASVIVGMAEDIGNLVSEISEGSADETIYILAGSDFQPLDGSAATGVNLMEAILDNIPKDYAFKGFLFAGDYNFNYDETGCTTGRDAVDKTVTGKYQTITHEVYVQGNHDPDSWAANNCSPSGANDPASGEYGVFVINERDYMWYNNDAATIQSTADNLSAYLTAKADTGYNKPIFVVSHLPLHYSLRTQVGRDDGKYAKYIFDVLQAAGEKGLNIIFMYGHNHSHGWDDYLGGHSVYLQPDNNINIAKEGSTTEYTVETLKFTYMNAGFVSYYRSVNTTDCYSASENTDTVGLTMTVFAINSDGTVNVERYDANGQHNLKCAGVLNKSHWSSGRVGSCCSSLGTETYAADTSTVWEDTITLTTPTVPNIVWNTDRTVSVTAEGLTSVEAAQGNVDFNQNTYTVTYAITPMAGEEKYTGQATVALDLPDAFSGAKQDQLTATVDGDSCTIVSWENGILTLSVPHFSDVEVTYAVAAATGDYTLTRVDVNSVADIATGTYVLVPAVDTGVAISTTMNSDGNGMTPYDVTITGNTIEYADGMDTAIFWDITNNGTTAVIQDSNEQYLTIGTSRLYLGSTAQQITLGVSGGGVTFANQRNDGLYYIDYYVNDRVFKSYNGNINDNKIYHLYRVTENAAVENNHWYPVQEGASEETVYQLVDTFTAGKLYVLVSRNTAGSGSAVYLNNTSASTGSVTVTDENGIPTVTAPGNAYVWTYTSAFKLQNVNNTGYYLRGRGSNNGNLRTTTNSGDSYTTWNVNADGKITTRNSTYGTTYYFDYYIYEETTLAADPAEYAKLTGTTSYSYIAGNKTRAEIGAEIQAGLQIYTNTTDSGDGTLLTDWSEVLIDTTRLDPDTAGTYILNVKYKDTSIGAISVTIADRQVTSIEANAMEGTIARGATYVPDVTLTVTYDDGTVEEVPLRTRYLSGTGLNTNANGTYENLTITYGGKTLPGFTLYVENVVGNDFPDYPDPGSVSVNKTATGIDFQNTGLTRVELSTSGLPAGKGVDVVVVVDTSSSMNDEVDGQKRIDVLRESLRKMLEQFTEANPTTGVQPDIDVAVISFNGYANQITGATLDGSYRTNADNSAVFTGPNAGQTISSLFNQGYVLSAEDFVNNQDAAFNPDTIADNFTAGNLKSGTNYDAAMGNAYNLLKAKKDSNPETREQYVIFLSDGAPFRYNGFNQGTDNGTQYPEWNRWLQGEWADDDALKNDETAWGTNVATTYSYFYNGNGTNHPHRIAEAIKGNPGVMYDVVDPQGAENDPAYISEWEGLGAKIYSIGFCLEADKGVTKETEQELIEVISSGAGYAFPDVTNADQLNEAFSQIAQSISYAARDAFFEDKMGERFDLQMNPTVQVSDGSTKQEDTDIIIKSFPVYTKEQVGTVVNGHTVTSDDVGKTYGDGIVIETVTFKDVKGVIQAFSSVKGETVNILNNGIIVAQNFWYNTTSSPKTITLEDGSSYMLEGESFRWNIGTIHEKQYTLSYVLKLTDALNGLEAGSYATNEYAKLTYVNWLGNTVTQDTVSPEMAWTSAHVSYGFYLVDSNGNPLMANGTSAENFLTAYKVTNPILHSEVLLNTDDIVEAKLEVGTQNILDLGYILYDKSAKYTVEINSGSGGGFWTIVKGDGLNYSTYVTNYATPNDYTYEDSSSLPNDIIPDYTNTIVWFAVVWNVGTMPDTVVIDYGLPVDINPLRNDMFRGTGVILSGIGEAVEGTTDDFDAVHGVSALTETTYSHAFGEATINNDKTSIRFTPKSTNMNDILVFAYEVNGGESNPGYYYGHVTIIPATSIYYEETFVTFNDSSAASGEMGTWTDIGTFVENATQAEDRPGYYSLFDANNIYGFDGINSTSTTYSLGKAKRVNVDAATGKPSTAPSAQFTFTGTGFDIISMTDNTSGAIFVNIRKDNAAGALVKQLIVDNYYGYKYEDTDGDGVKEWISDSTSTGKIYQVPVIKLSGLDHGTYHVTIQVAYMTAFDHQPNDSLYTFVLDSIRIYDPVNPAEADTVITDAYKADGEFNPTYTLIKDKILDPTKINNSESSVTTIKGVVFIDGMNKTDNAFDYSNPGPNNETYLAVGQYVTFKIQTNFEPDKTMIGAKIASGTSVTLTVSYTTGEDNQQHTITNGKTITTATDMYYELAAITWTRLTQTDESGNVTYLDKWVSPIITLSNGQAVKNESDTEYATNAILSLTNLKITEKIASTGNIISGDSTVIDTPDGVFGTETTAPASASYEAIVTDGMLAPEINDGDIAPTPIEGSIEAAAPAFEEVEAPAPETVEESEEPEADTAVEVIETDTPNTITLIVDQEVIDHANFILNPVFEPEYIQYKTKKVGFGSFATNYLLVVTSNDVASLTANGVALTKVTSNYQVTTRFGSMRSLEKEFGVDIDGGEYTMWMYSSKDASFEIVAGNSEGICSEPVAAEVASSGGIGSFFGSLIGSVLDSFFGKKETAEEIEVPDYSEIMKQLAQRYFNPEKFEADIGERADSKKQLVIEASEDVAYVIVNGKIIRNYITETVVDLENNGEETVKRIFVAYVSGEGSVEIAAYNAEGVASSAKVAEN